MTADITILTAIIAILGCMGWCCWTAPAAYQDGDTLHHGEPTADQALREP